MRTIWAILLGVLMAANASALCAAEDKHDGKHMDQGDGDKGGSHGHHEHIGHAGMGPDAENPAEFKSDLAIWTFVVFVLLLLILWKFAWGPITEGLDRRERNIAEHIAAAERSNEDAKRMLAEYEKRLANAAAEVRELLEEARRDAEQVKAEIVAEGKKGAEQERARALREIESATDAALKQLAEKSATLAVDLAGKILKTQLKPGDHTRLVQEAITLFTQRPSKN